MIPGSLFVRESHLQFPELLQPATDDVRALAAQFGVETALDHVTRIQKRADNSSLFLLDSEGAGKRVLRVCAREEADLVERQCEAIMGSGFRGTIRPCRTAAGTLVARTSTTAAILYPYREGTIFGGDPGLLRPAIETIAGLLEALRPSAVDLPCIEHQPAEWMPLFGAILQEGTFRSPLFAAHLQPDAAEQGLGALLRLEDPIQRATELWSASTPVVVHNDLNHANLLQEGETFCVLDIEDIVREVPQVALAHGIFKLSRHVVFADPARVSHVIEQLRTVIMPNVIAAGWMRTPEEMRLFSLFRIVSNVHGIIRHTLDHHDARYLYDLQKRIDNALESEILFRGQLN